MAKSDIYTWMYPWVSISTATLKTTLRRRHALHAKFIYAYM